jgi:hypothetical protein
MMNDKTVNTALLALEGIGAIFVGLFLAVYLGGLFVVPQTTVFHSDPTIKLTLAILGILFLIAVLATVVLAAIKRKK